MSPSKILIVEDETIVALDMRARLSRFGYQVVGIADSGEEALHYAEVHQPDLVLMDIRLKGQLDGIQTAQHLRDQYGIPVVYLTAYADDLTLERAKPTQPLGYLIKPFEERELHSTIEMALYKIGMDQKLREQAIRMQKIISTVPEGIALLDTSHRIVLANARAQEYLAALCGGGLGDIVSHLGNIPIEGLLRVQNQENWHEITLSDPDPRVFEVIVSLACPDSEVDEHSSMEWVLVIRDVTIEREIQQRIQAQERLATVGQLAAGIAHDFNNILSSIILEPYMVLKAEPALSSKSRERLDTISCQAKRASELIKQILDFSRTSAMETEAFEVVPVLEELTRMLERMLPDDIRLELIYAPDEYTMEGDSTRILQVLMNLALNSRDAMPNGGTLRVALARVPYAAIRLENNTDVSEWIEIKIADNGTGISPHTLPHIFEPFFTTKPAGQGTGLGLAQAYGIVQQHGGHITVDSQEGHGSTFSVYFPAVASTPLAQTSLEPEMPVSYEGSQQTILLVEDNYSARQSISEILQLSNYHVLTASNGHQALATLEEVDNAVDLIVSDLTMPEMGGLELCRELRDQNVNVGVIILTGCIADDVLSQLRALAVTDFLDKPVDVQELLVAIDRSLHKTSQPEQG